VNFWNRCTKKKESIWNMWCEIIVDLIDKWNHLKKEESVLWCFLLWICIYNLNIIMDSSTFNYAIIMLIWSLHAEPENTSKYSKTFFIFLHRILNAVSKMSTLVKVYKLVVCTLQLPKAHTTFFYQCSITSTKVQSSFVCTQLLAYCPCRGK
jgi:hypothetical protein